MENCNATENEFYMDTKVELEKQKSLNDINGVYQIYLWLTVILSVYILGALACEGLYLSFMNNVAFQIQFLFTGVSSVGMLYIWALRRCKIGVMLISWIVYAIVSGLCVFFFFQSETEIEVLIRFVLILFAYKVVQIILSRLCLSSSLRRRGTHIYDAIKDAIYKKFCSKRMEDDERECNKTMGDLPPINGGKEQEE